MSNNTTPSTPGSVKCQHKRTTKQHDKCIGPYNAYREGCLDCGATRVGDEMLNTDLPWTLPTPAASVAKQPDCGQGRAMAGVGGPVPATPADAASGGEVGDWKYRVLDAANREQADTIRRQSERIAVLTEALTRIASNFDGNGGQLWPPETDRKIAGDALDPIAPPQPSREPQGGTESLADHGPRLHPTMPVSQDSDGRCVPCVLLTERADHARALAAATAELEMVNRQKRTACGVADELGRRLRERNAQLIQSRDESAMLRGALEKVKSMVVGDARPRWDGLGAVTVTRGVLADIVDAALHPPTVPANTTKPEAR